MTQQPKPTVVDAHHHLWDRKQTSFHYDWLDSLELQPISQSHLPEDLAPQLKSMGVEQTVVVQTQHLMEENNWALNLAQRHPWIAGVVGWVDLTSQECETQLTAYNDNPKFVGVRHVIQDEADDFVVRTDVLNGLRVLEKHQVPFDLLVYQRQLHHAPTVARQCPDLKIVLDHLGKPNIKDRQHGYSSWLPLIGKVAECKNVYCKLSGLVTEADWNGWTIEDLRPYLETAIELFGPKRCMFGSDWPVCRLAGEYREVFQVLQKVVSELSTDEQNQIMGMTAAQFYQLPISG